MEGRGKHKILLSEPRVKQWYDNLAARSKITADVSLRVLGNYCLVNNSNPLDLLKNAQNGTLKDEFTIFVRKMEGEGKAGGYISKYKKVLLNWIRYNDIEYQLRINIRGENETPTIADERVPSRDELARILRKASSRGRVAAAMMAFSGLRPESLGNYEGNDGIKLSDIEDLKISENKIEFENTPAKLIIRVGLSKTRNRYFTFIPEECTTYIREYLEERIASGEKLTKDSPLLQFDPRGNKRNKFIRTMLVTRDVREAIRSAGLSVRPYVLRAYFATALDISESKGLISHPWRQFIMGHKGDMEARYSTNKGRLPPEMIEDMRKSYQKCTKYLETRSHDPSEGEAKSYLQTQLLMAVGYKQEEIDKMDLASMENEDFQKLLKDKVAGAMTKNGSKQKLVNIDDVGQYLEEGYEFQASLPNGKAVMKLPF